MILPQTDRDIPTPAGCLSCRFCGSHRNIYAEAVDDWWGRGIIIRIGCLCDSATRLSSDPDLSRTNGYQPEKEAIQEWNEMNLAMLE